MTTKRQMRLVTDVTLPTALPHAWDLITNPAVMGDCLPGLVAWRAVQPGRVFHLLLAWGGENTPQPGRGQIPVRLDWTALHPPTRMELTAEIAFGSQIIPARGRIRLAEAGAAATALTLQGEVETDNPLLQRLIAGAAPKLLDGFFRRLKTHIE
jgi:carbon monoxide dehydrogenase subunit G